MISDQISQLITQVKQHPNGIRRNKVVSHLEDAFANALVLERDEFMGDVVGIKPNAQQSKLMDQIVTECICPAPGVRNKNCISPVHK